MMKRWGLASLAVVLFGCGKPAAEPLLVYCGAGIREPVEKAAKQFEAENGRPIRLQFGPSQAILAQAEVSHLGNLYLPGDDSYVELGRAKGLVTKSLAVASMAPVLAVRKGNPKGVRSLDDLLRSDVKFGQVNPDAAAAGKLVRAVLQAAGRWEAVAAKTVVYAGTVNEVASSVRLGALDAGFIWDVLATQDLEFTPIPELNNVRAQVTVGLLKSGEGEPASWTFAEYLASPSGGEFFKRAGFGPPR